jgi:hypothetical protein
VVASSSRLRAPYLGALRQQADAGCRNGLTSRAGRDPASAASNLRCATGRLSSASLSRPLRRSTRRLGSDCGAGVLKPPTQFQPLPAQGAVSMTNRPSPDAESASPMDPHPMIFARARLFGRRAAAGDRTISRGTRHKTIPKAARLELHLHAYATSKLNPE